jgi:rhodanese-related sulfurtransferase
MKKINEKNIIKLITVVVFIFFIFSILKKNNFTENDFVKSNSVVFENKEISKKDNLKKNIHKLISPQEYKEKLDSGEYEHLDIRTKSENSQEKISDGLLINFYSDNFVEELGKLDKNKKYIYHCRSGSRSSQAIPIFRKLGFKEIYELDGGINN